MQLVQQRRGKSLSGGGTALYLMSKAKLLRLQKEGTSLPVWKSWCALLEEPNSSKVVQMHGLEGAVKCVEKNEQVEIGNLDLMQQQWCVNMIEAGIRFDTN